MKPLQLSGLMAGICVAVMAVCASAAGHLHHHTCHFCGHKTCRLKVEAKTESVPCFEVECKDVCIPPITFPWECRPSACAKVRTVRVLTEEERDKKVCHYSWEVITICPRCRGALQESGCDVAPGVIPAELDDAH